VRSIKSSYQPIAWLGDRVRLLDQTKLPREEVYLELNDYRDVASAIKEMKVRGAPAIAIAGAYTVALGARQIDVPSRSAFLEKLDDVIEHVSATRPTARNLFAALERLKRVAAAGKSAAAIRKALAEEAVKIHHEESAATARIGRYGAGLIKAGWTVLTHCNTGPLAAPDSGTALGVIARAHQQGKKVKVIATETRPLLQGARLTTWELKKLGIPATVVTDSAAGYFIRAGKVDCVITGADRIAANGDTANKIGTYTLAVLAKENNIPFYIAAPVSTIDMSLRNGDEIPIEERNPAEVTLVQGVPVAPEGIAAANPAFDVTPHRYITAIITDKGIVKKPYRKGLEELFRKVSSK
jgi:methylthioribose-1-phosphate isomerase